MSARGYHHGDLSNAVKQAALQVLATDGPAALSLRQVAARAGVSHTAPRHHFGDKRRLLTELAIDGFEQLSAELANASRATPDPVHRLAELLVGYVAHRREHPGHAAIMWRTDLVDGTDPRLHQARLAALRALHDAVRQADTPLGARIGTFRLSLMLWSLAQGTSDLADLLTPQLASAIGEDDPHLPPPTDLVRDFVEAITS